jgi:hypothetical protein
MKRLIPALVGLGICAAFAALPLTAFALFGEAPASGIAITLPLSEGTASLIIKISEVINIVLILVAGGLMLSIIKRYGTEAQLSGVFGYFLAGALALGFSRLFIFLAETGFIPVSDDTLNLGWHLIFYISMVTFFLGGRSLAIVARAEGPASSLKSSLGWGGFMALYVIAVFAAAEAIDTPFTAVFNTSLFNQIGGLHVIAFVAAALAAWYLFQRARVGQITVVLATPILIAFLLLSLEHVWELLNESLHLFALTPDALGELVEELFSVPACFLVVVAFSRLKKLLMNPA